MTTETFHNAHVSYSRLRRYADCPKSFELHYVRGEPAEPNDSLRFGGLIHEVLEAYFHSLWQARFTGEIRASDLQEIFKAHWPASGLTSHEHFRDGMVILGDFVARHPTFDHARILGVEQEFSIALGPYTLRGYIDRIERGEDGTIEIWDYKTSRVAHTQVEADTDLQLSSYAMAAQQLYPDASRVDLSLYFLRHGLKLTTRRTDRDLQIAAAYLETLARQTETAAEFPARLSANCVYCDHRSQCEAYQKALASEEPAVTQIRPTDLEAVAAERERAARVARFAYARKADLDRVLIAHLAHQDTLVLAGVRYAVGPDGKVVATPLRR
jgi:putative RecB family exonuclease